MKIIKAKKRAILGRLFLYGILLLAIINFIVEFKTEEEWIAGTETLQTTKSKPPKVIKSAQDMVNAVNRNKTIVPDRRLLNSLLNIPELISGSESNESYKIDLVAKEWTLSLDDKVVLSLPRQLGVSEYYVEASKIIPITAKAHNFTLIDGKLNAEAKRLSKDIDSWEHPKIVPALLKLSTMYETDKSNLDLFRLIARGTTILALLTDDYFINDTGLETHALALFTILKHFKPEGIEIDEALIALMLEHEAYREASLAKVKNDEAFDLYRTENLPKFVQYVNSASRNPRDVYLYLKLLTSDNHPEKFFRQAVNILYQQNYYSAMPWLSKVFLKRYTHELGHALALNHLIYLMQATPTELETLPALKVLFKTMKYFTGQFVMSIMRGFFPNAAINEHLTSWFKLDRWLYLFYEITELKIANAAKDHKAKIFTAKHVKDFYHALLYDILAKHGNQQVSVYSSPERTKELIASLEEFPWPEAQTYRLYLQASFELSFTHPKNSASFVGMLRYPDLAPYRTMTLLDSYVKRVGVQQVSFPTMLDMIRSKLDLRPSYEKYVESLVRDYAFDPWSSELALESQRVSKKKGRRDIEFQLSEARRSRVNVQSLLSAQDIPHEVKVMSLLRADAEDKAQVQEYFLKYLEHSPQDYSSVYWHAEDLEKSGKVQESYDFVLKSLTYFKETDDLTGTALKTKLARLAMKLNKAAEAQTYATEAYKSGSADSFHVYAEYLEFAKDYEGSLKILEALVVRYPQSRIGPDLARLHLIGGRPEKALAALKQYIFPYAVLFDSQDLGKKLVEVQKIKPEIDLTPFYKLLSEDKDTKSLFSQIAAGFSEAGQHKEAIELVETYVPEALSQGAGVLQIRNSMDYRYMDYESTNYYLAKLVRRFDQAGRIPDGINFVKAKAGEMLLPYVIYLGDDLSDDARLAVFNELKERNDPRTQFAALALARHYVTERFYDERYSKVLKDFYSADDQQTYYYKMGRFLVTGQGLDEAEALAEKENLRHSFCFFKAVHLDSRDEMKEANLWYQAAAYIPNHSYERMWANDILRDWLNRNLFLIGNLRERKKKLLGLSNQNPLIQERMARIDQQIVAMEAE